MQLRGSRRLFVAMVAILGIGVMSVQAASSAASAREPVHAMAVGDVIAGYKNQFPLSTAANQQVRVARLNVPAGNFTIFAKTYTTVGSDGYGRTVRCVLSAGQDFDESWVSFDGITPNAMIALNVNHYFAVAGVADLTCGFAFQSGSTSLQFVKITAIAAGNISNVPLS